MPLSAFCMEGSLVDLMLEEKKHDITMRIGCVVQQRGERGRRWLGLGVVFVALIVSSSLCSCYIMPPQLSEPDTPVVAATGKHDAEQSPAPGRTPTQLFTPAQTLLPAQPLVPGRTPVRVRARVVRVVDGDTIIVSLDGQERRLRYIGIDCPELAHSGKPREWMAREASEANERLVGGRIVYLEKDVSETDRYGRLLRYVWVGDRMVNAELVRLGYAHAITYPPDVKHQDLLRAAQREAREAKRGLWGEIPTETPSAEAAAAISYTRYDGVIKRVGSGDKRGDMGGELSTPQILLAVLGA